jgi:hypothetical protein
MSAAVWAKLEFNFHTVIQLHLIKIKFGQPKAISEEAHFKVGRSSNCRKCAGARRLHPHKHVFSACLHNIAASSCVPPDNCMEEVEYRRQAFDAAVIVVICSGH